jgi:uncharacterized membrane protein YqjE
MDKISGTILKFLRLDNIVNNLTSFVETRIELAKVEIREDVTKAVARGLVVVVLFLIGFLFLVFFSIGLAHFLNGLFGEAYAGYWSVAGIYAATFLLLLVFKTSLYKYFERQFSDLINRKEK